MANVREAKGEWHHKKKKPAWNGGLMIKQSED